MVDVVCFPHAGGGVAAFAPWSRHRPADVGLIFAHLPGRDGRRGERCRESAQDIADEMAVALLQLDHKPRVLFGHSMGALLAFETARRLQAAGRPPAALVVSARRAPTRPERFAPMAHLSEDEFIARIQARYGGAIPAAVLAEPELRDLLLPTLRADIALVERYAFEPGDRLRCPIHAYGGADDPNATLEELDDWSLQTDTPGIVRQFAGGHFYTQTAPGDVLTALLSDTGLVADVARSAR